LRPLFWSRRRSGGTGRRAGLKIRWPSGREGSTPSFGIAAQKLSSALDHSEQGGVTERRTVLITLSLVAFAAPVSGSSSGSIPVAAAPVIVAVAPHGHPTDRPGGGFLRVTFSPDGDGRKDQVRVLVRSRPGERLVLDVRPESNPKQIEIGSATPRSSITTLTWDGLDPEGRAWAPGSYVLSVCSGQAGLCAATRVLAHVRILSVFTPRGPQAVSPSETIPVIVETDRIGPYALELASVADPRGQGIGTRTVTEPGETAFRLPRVSGGMWLLRVRSGPFVSYYPLVLHDPSLALGAPPPGTALVVHPYITWRAYDRADLNRDGEVDSWYSHPRRPVIPVVGPFERVRREPVLAGREASPGAQQAFARWLTRHRLTAQHVTDIELGRLPGSVLARYAVVVFPGHTEYYERGTYDRLLAYRNSGGRLYFLQGNSFYGEVAVRATSIVRLSYRYRTGTRSDFHLAVTGYRSCCWPASINPRYRLAPGVRERLPWLLDGTGLGPGDLFGVALREVDTVDAQLSPRGTVRIASAVVPRFAGPGDVHAYRWIGSRRIPYEPAAIRDRRIDVAYAATGRGEVFSWGNCGFMQSLNLDTLPAAERAALDQAALNVWKRFTR
jgi:hypothetical protein